MDGSIILYLENQISSECEDCLTLPSRICLFLLNTLQADLADSSSFKADLADSSSFIKLVSVAQSLCLEQSCGILKSTEKLSFTHINSEDCPKAVKAVKLPVLISNKGQMVHCGLSSVLRKMLKHVHMCYPSQNFITLLGHHEMCLRSCAEVSVWTKFCEVEMLEMLERLNHNQESMANSAQGRPFTVPDELLKLEDHFHKPAVIPQITKKKKQIYHQLMNNDIFIHRKTCDGIWIDSLNALSMTEYLENKLNREPKLYSKILKELRSPSKIVCQDVKIPGLSHDFAEGVEVTLTDLVLLPCVSCVLAYSALQGTLQDLVASVPCVVRWYQRLTSVTTLTQALREAGVPVVDIWDKVQVPVCIKQPLHRNIDSLVKQKTKISTNDAGLVLNKLQTVGNELDTNLDTLRDVHLDWSNLPDAVHPQEGCLPNSRITRKCEQLENLAQAVLGVAKPGHVIVDFCAGGGHLGILLAYLLPDCEVLLIENKEESIRRAMDRVLKLDLKNITLYQSNLDYFHGRFDIGTCLHACGVATDLVLHQCIQASASFVICPCCYGAVQNSQSLSYPQSHKYRTSLTYEEYLFLAHAADDENAGKKFMIAVDRDRHELACKSGYNVTLKSLTPLTCSPKNNLLIGQCTV